ncbi:MAG: hypothetical protein GY757_38160 [bacterium]|nr:hypothetical protein [bacterium]
MIKKSYLFVLLLLFAAFVFGGKAVPLPDVLKPGGIAIDESQIYIWENTTVHIYSLKDFSLKKTFGKKGEGPQEFKSILGIVPQKESLFVNSMGKIFYFSKDGTYRKEAKTTDARGFFPVGNSFFGRREIMEDKTVFLKINLYDATFKLIKEIAKLKYAVQDTTQQLLPLIPPLEVNAYAGKLFVTPAMDFLIDVYNDKGEKLHSIKQAYKKQPVSDDFKNKTDHFLKTSPNFKKYYELLKGWLKFPDYFPAIRRVCVNDNKIFVQTYMHKGDQSEFHVLDFKGKLLKTVWLTFADPIGINLDPLFTISGDKLYQLVENEEKEIWELRILDI